MNAAPLVTVRGLRVDAGTGPVLQGVDLTLTAGRSVAVVGESGSGKTTLARALLGALPPGLRHAGGTVRISGHAMLPRPADHVRGAVAAYVGQETGLLLNPYRRIGRTLAAAVGTRESGPVFAALTRVGLDPALADRYPRELSGGQQQRTVLAIAMARRPRLLVLDEPTSALDPVAVDQVRGALAGLRDDGVSLVWVTHDLASLDGIVDDIVVLDRGRLAEHGPARPLLESPRTPAGARLVRASHLPERPLRPPRLSSPVLVAAGLQLGYDGRTVLTGHSLSLHSRSCVALVGPSGVGKTTLGRCLAGLHPQDAGTVSLDGNELATSARRRNRADRAAIQLVPQDPAATLHPRQTVRTALERHLRLAAPTGGGASPADEVARLLELVHLPASWADRRPGELSGGQRQRVAVARALASRPRVLVCDEITSALDSVTRSAIVDLLAELRDSQELALLVISHDAQVVRALADEVQALGANPTADRQVLAPPAG